MPHYDPMFYRWDNEGPEKGKDLAKITQLLHGNVLGSQTRTHQQPFPSTCCTQGTVQGVVGGRESQQAVSGPEGLSRKDRKLAPG